MPKTEDASLEKKIHEIEDGIADFAGSVIDTRLPPPPKDLNDTAQIVDYFRILQTSLERLQEFKYQVPEWIGELSQVNGRRPSELKDILILFDHELNSTFTMIVNYCMIFGVSESANLVSENLEQMSKYLESIGSLWYKARAGAHTILARLNKSYELKDHGIEETFKILEEIVLAKLYLGSELTRIASSFANAKGMNGKYTASFENTSVSIARFDNMAVLDCLANFVRNAKKSMALVKPPLEKRPMHFRAYDSDNYIIFEVGDTGIGVDPNIVSDIFKGQGVFDGTKIGLKTTLATMGAHNGCIEVETAFRQRNGSLVHYTYDTQSRFRQHLFEFEAATGATFRLYIPISHKKVE